MEAHLMKMLYGYNDDGTINPGKAEKDRGTFCIVEWTFWKFAKRISRNDSEEMEACAHQKVTYDKAEKHVPHNDSKQFLCLQWSGFRLKIRKSFLKQGENLNGIYCICIKLKRQRKLKNWRHCTIRKGVPAFSTWMRPFSKIYFHRRKIGWRFWKMEQTQRKKNQASQPPP